jgi:CRISPR-associated protein Cas5t
MSVLISEKVCSIRVDLAQANFRKSYARSFAETYDFAPPATVYGMFLSLVGEYNKSRHEGVKFAFAYRRLPEKSQTMHKLSRLKYGVASKQSAKGNVPEFVENITGIDFFVVIDSSNETNPGPTLAESVRDAIEHPETVKRTGALYLGLSDNMVNIVELFDTDGQQAYRLIPKNTGTVDMPRWVDHYSSSNSRWQRFAVDEEPTLLENWPTETDFVTVARQ